MFSSRAVIKGRTWTAILRRCLQIKKTMKCYNFNLYVIQLNNSNIVDLGYHQLYRIFQYCCEMFYVLTIVLCYNSVLIFHILNTHIIWIVLRTILCLKKINLDVKKIRPRIINILYDVLMTKCIFRRSSVRTPSLATAFLFYSS